MSRLIALKTMHNSDKWTVNCNQDNEQFSFNNNITRATKVLITKK
jgi:hypothetical protein